MEENNDLVVLVDEEGEEHTFIVVDVIPLNEMSYAILMPQTDKDSSNGEVDVEDLDAYIFRVIDKDGEQVLEEVEEEDEWNLVAEAWESSINDLDEELDSDA